MTDQGNDEIRQAVREHYGRVAVEGSGCGCGTGCCGASPTTSLALGYTSSDLEAAPEGANLGLGCGNPQAIAALRPGEDVLDLGSGGGFDCFLAAKQVGPEGRVIGVDMTPEMVARARANAKQLDAQNVEFRLGEIEHLPVADASVDVVLSNCVVNLSPDKPAVLREVFRVLRPGGRIALSDVVATAPLPCEIGEGVAAYMGCVAGAALVDDLRGWLDAAGFVETSVRVDEASRAMIGEWLPGTGAERFVASASIKGVKPNRAPRA
ncbi:arsenite methyltransferase [Anaeromyxobacter sp. PSR-1]|uniref:arsenite methyltransferase n=1 Tax=Anaeromyxobacter sp. PSR-1 TaxID=1300915 RepID=UPI0005DC1C36|nr:arsenite methyltransferase [Anaeromyxobacter sp. PSR-1]GAO01463.1 putative arsenite methyltransferase [Anaeromyxobacter sp. PSR-1]